MLTERANPTTVKALLEKLSVSTSNPGACFGADGWIDEPGAALRPSINPATGETIAFVSLASGAACDRVVAEAARAFESWRERPAPKRGDLVRDLGSALRDAKEPLG